MPDRRRSEGRWYHGRRWPARSRWGLFTIGKGILNSDIKISILHIYTYFYIWYHSYDIMLGVLYVYYILTNWSCTGKDVLTFDIMIIIHVRKCVPISYMTNWLSIGKYISTLDIHMSNEITIEIRFASDHNKHDHYRKICWSSDFTCAIKIENRV